MIKRKRMYREKTKHQARMRLRSGGDERGRGSKCRRIEEEEERRKGKRGEEKRRGEKKGMKEEREERLENKLG